MNLFLLLWAAHAAPVTDALSWVDDFTDPVGVDVAASTGVSNLGGSFRATQQSAELVTDCIALAPPAGGVFEGWAFLDLETSGWVNVSSATVQIEACTGATLLTQDLSGSCDAVDLSAITEPRVRVRIAVDHTSPGVSPLASIDRMAMVGRSSGTAGLSLTASPGALQSGEILTLATSLNADAATLIAPEVVVDLEAMNLDPTLVEDGWTDELGYTRPVEFLGASPGLQGEAPSVPAGGTHDEAVLWALQDVDAGTAGDLTLDVVVPVGTIDGRTVAGAVSITHGATSTCDPSLDGRMTFEADTRAAPVTVSSVMSQDPYAYSPDNTVRSGQDYYINTVLDSTIHGEIGSSDMEDVLLTVTPPTGCALQYESYSLHFSNSVFRVHEVISEPPPGDWTTPLVIRIPRVDPISIYPRLITNFSGPPSGTCPDGTDLSTTHTFESATPAYVYEEPEVFTFDADDKTCRTASGNQMMRSMTGDELPNDYNHFPSNAQETYVYGFSNNERTDPFSVAPGDWYAQWTPYSNGGVHSPTVLLDAGFWMGVIPPHATFHGLRSIGASDLLAYKDCTDTAIEPAGTGFDIADPTLSGWVPMDATWQGPFDTDPDPADPRAIVPSGCRVLFAWGEDGPPIRTTLRNTSVLRVCDSDREALGWCTTPALNSAVDIWGTEVALASVHNGVVQDCQRTEPAGPSDYYLEEASWPRVFGTSVTTQVPAGQVAQIVLAPHNEHQASRPVDGVWSFDLMDIRELVDFAGMTASVELPAGSVVPNDGDIADITVHLPDETSCLAASDGDASCLVWFEVPPELQLPNYYGVREATVKGRANVRETYEFRLNLPLSTDAPAGANRDVVAQARAYTETADLCSTNDDCAPDARCSDAGVCWVMGELGANNISPRYDCAEACSDAIPIQVLEVPNLVASKTGPATWPDGWFSYELEATNRGNAPQIGWYMVDRLPQAGTLGGDITPAIGQILVSQAAADVVIEYTAAADCHLAPVIADTTSWTPLTPYVSSRPDLPTAASGPPGSAACVRIRRSDNGRPLAPGDTVSAVIEAQIPAGTADHLQIANVAYVGSAAELGSATPVLPTATDVVRTEVSDALTLAVDKSATVSATEAGLVSWTLSWRNASGADEAAGAILTDCLPQGVTLDAVDLPLGVSCPTPACDAPPTPACPGGELTLTIDSIAADDRSAGGADEGEVVLHTRVDGDVGTEKVNLVTLLPNSAGTGDEATATIHIGGGAIDKRVEPVVDRGTDTVLDGDEVLYTLDIRNDDTITRFMRIHDELPSGATFVADSMTIDGASASNALFNGGTLAYLHPVPLSTGESVTLGFRARIHTNGAGGTIANLATVVPCTDVVDLSACSTGTTSEPAVVEVQVCANDTLEGDETCDDGNTVDFDGCSSTCQIEADSDGDGWYDAYENTISRTDPTVADTDGDGIDDPLETETSPLDADSDDDGLSDGDEELLGTDWLDPDTDGDFLLDGVEMGVADGIEPGTSAGGVIFLGSSGYDGDADPLTMTDPLEADTDGDGLPDGEEDFNHDGAFAHDQPGLADDETDPTNADSDGDGIDDQTEGGPGLDDEDGDDTIDALDPCRGDHVLPDSDGDGFCDGDDLCPGQDDNADADGDLVPDGCDVCAGFDDALDADSDGIPDGCDFCGDGILDPGEFCDDGNNLDQDGCSANCILEGDTDGDTLPDVLEESLGTDPLLADTDGDGLDDAEETDGPTLATDADSDDDGISDGDEELLYGTDPLDHDSDDDLLPDGLEVGIYSPIAATISPSGLLVAGTDISVDHFIADADPNSTTNPLLPDTDGDDLFDSVEDVDHNGAFDGDRPGLLDDETDPNTPDSDDDGLDDFAEGGPGAFDADGDDTIDALDPCWGDHSTGDSDLDAVCDAQDVCPGFDDALDLDADSIPDDCDVCPGFDDTEDTDGDGVPNGCDICDGLADGADLDGDFVPDACDVCDGFDDALDADGDLVPDGCDVCANGDDRRDSDGDLVPNDCDVCIGDDRIDTDEDAVPDDCDICPTDPFDDSDGDTICDGVDLCSGADDRVDADEDTIPDGCDQCEGYDDRFDEDDDGVPNGCDLCFGNNGSGDIDEDGLCDDIDPINDLEALDDEPDEDKPDACGCASGSPSWAWLMLLVLVGRRRD